MTKQAKTIIRRTQSDREQVTTVQRLQSILANSPAVTYTLKADGHFETTFTSDNIEELSGYKAEDFFSDPDFWKSRIHPADQKRVVDERSQIFATGSLLYEYRFLCKNGQYSWIRDESKLVRNQGPYPDEVVGSWLDITHLKNKEQALKRKEREFHAAEKIAHIGFWKLEFGTNVLTWSPEMSAILGYPPEVERKQYKLTHSAIHPDDRTFVAQAIDDAVRNMSPYSIECRIVRPDGEQRHVFVQAEVCRDEQGTPLYLSGILIDVTERKRNEQTLYHSQQTNRALLNAVPDALVLIQLDGTVVDVNIGMAQRYGLTREEMLGRDIHEILHPEVAQRGKQGLAEVVKTRQPHTFSMSHDGMFQENYLAPVFDIDGKVIQVAIVSRDQTEKYTHERQIEDYQRKLRALSAELTMVEERKVHEIIDSLHDNVGPLLSLASLRTNLLKSREQLREKQQALDEISALLKQSIGSIRTVISDLRPPLLQQRPFAASITWLAEFFLMKNGIRFTFIEDGERQLLADNSQMILFHVLRELMINIIKHSAATDVDVKLCWSAERVCIKIADNGVGFDVTAHSAGSYGCSLGLFSVHERLLYLDGDVEFKSQPGKGTKITVCVPLTADRHDRKK